LDVVLQNVRVCATLWNVKIREAGVEKTPEFYCLFLKKTPFCNLHVFCMGTHEREKEMQ
jgi:hypothetical protein